MDEQTRINEIVTAFNSPENQALLNQLVDAFNYLYSSDGLNMIVQVHSREDESGRSWVALIEDNYSIDGALIQVVVTPDKNVSQPKVIRSQEIT